MADQKATPAVAKRPGEPLPAPRRVGDQIIFYCPNGDRIVVPATLGGKTGACTKCKVKVVIPTPEAAPPAAEPAPSEPVGGPVSEPAGGPPAVEPPPLDAADHQVIGGAPPEPTAAPPVDWDLVAGQSVAAVLPEETPFGIGGGDDMLPGIVPGPDHHPAARLVARLWQERAHGGVIELHLVGGSVILPEWYEVNWSRGTHGLFASQAADGTVTMTAIAWDTLEKIVVRQVRDLPHGFE